MNENTAVQCVKKVKVDDFKAPRNAMLFTKKVSKTARNSGDGAPTVHRGVKSLARKKTLFGRTQFVASQFQNASADSIPAI